MKFKQMLTEYKKEFVIWGIPTGKKEEDLLYTKATSELEAKKMCKYLQDKKLATKCRVQIIDFSIKPDFKNVFN